MSTKYTVIVEWDNKSISTCEVTANDNYDALKKGLIELQPEDSKNTEILFQQSEGFPKTYDDLVESFKQNDIEITAMETSLYNSLTQNVEKFEDIDPSELTNIIVNRISTRFKVSQEISNTNKLNEEANCGGIELEFSEPAFVADKEIVSRILAMSLTGGSTDLKSRFNTFFVLVFANGGKIFFKNSETNDDCLIRIAF